MSTQNNIFSQPVDNDALTLTRAIALQESSKDGKTPNYNAVGDAGTSHGAYQWQPGNFQAAAKQYGLNPNDFSPENQDKVAYAQVKSYKDQGYQPAQIASLWNSGSPDKWQNHKGTTVINGQTISYDTPKYVEGVKSYYQKLYTPSAEQSNSEVQSVIGGTDNQDAPSVGGFINNIASSAGNVAEGLGTAIAHPLNTLQGLGHVAGGAIEEGLSSLIGKDNVNVNSSDTQAFDNLKHYFGQRYGGSSPSEIASNIVHSAYKDPVGVALDLSTLLDGVGAGVGVAGKLSDASRAAELAKGSDFVSTANGLARSASPEGLAALNQAGTATKIGNALQTAADYTNPISGAGKAIGGVVNGVGRLAGESLGVGTGVGYGVIKEGMNAASQGGDASQAFLDGLRGNISPEELVNQAKSAIGEMVQRRSSEYQTQLAKIAGDTKEYNVEPILSEIDKQLQNFNISKTAEGQLDFSRSAIRFSSEAKQDIQNIFDAMQSFGTKAGDRTAVGIDSLKQAFGDLYSPSGKARAFVSAVTKKTREVLKDVPGYDKLTGDYENATAPIKDIQKGLSLGDKAMVETSFKKLTSALRQNNEMRQALVKELNAVTDGKLLPSIAGQQLNSIVPRGLAKYGDLTGAYHILTAGTGVIPLLFSMVATSPRIVGEFIAKLGLGEKATKQLVNLIETKTGVKIGTFVRNATEANVASQKR